MANKPREVWHVNDDWTLAQSISERRKLQNRLNQRISRKRKHLKRFSLNEDPKAYTHTVSLIGSNDQTAASVSDNYPQGLVKFQDLPILLSLERYPFHRQIADFIRQLILEWHLNHPNPYSLPGLTRLNTLDALLRNAIILQIPVHYLESDDYDSVFNDSQSSPNLVQRRELPADLLPTALQATVTHHSWLDLFPFPKMRDNILQGISTGQLDEEQLCEQLCCYLLEHDATSMAALVIWGEAWSAESWEFRPEFFRRWGYLLKGCPQALETTNYWRQKRGEMKLEFSLGS